MRAITFELKSKIGGKRQHGEAWNFDLWSSNGSWKGWRREREGGGGYERATRANQNVNELSSCD